MTAIRCDEHSGRCVARLLRRYRLRWLNAQVEEVMRRHKEAVVLVVCLVPFSPKFLGWIFTSLAVMDAAHALQNAAALVVLLAAGVLWVHVYRRAVDGGPLQHYLASLPVPAAPLRRIDAVAVALLDTPIWLMAVAGAATAPFERMSAAATTVFGVRLVLLLAVLLTVQVLYVRDARAALLAAIAGGGLAWASGFLPPPAAAALLATGVLASIGLFFGPSLARAVAPGYRSTHGWR